MGDNVNWGQFAGPDTAASVPGTAASGTVYLDLYAWEGNTFSTYDAAFAGGDYCGSSGVFSQSSGGGANPPPALWGLPDVVVGGIPEPGTLALTALGGASLLLFRFRKH
ncbi:MAG: PEP-CTERM sorting domain-containing protein [Verrucomicrobiota bacterium]